MEKESHICGVCFQPYNTKDQTPRVLNCGHTLCSSCLIEIIDSPDLRKCPFDNDLFKRSQKSLDQFPTNFALLALLEGRTENTCEIHHKKLKIFCLKDKVRICSECGLFGAHTGHPIRKIAEMMASGVKAKKELQEKLLKLKGNQFEKNSEVEALRKRCFGKIENEIGEIEGILKKKKLKWKKQVESVFERDVDGQLKDETSKAIEEINQALKSEDHLALLDRDFNSVISRVQPQLTPEEVLKFSVEASKKMSFLESFLVKQANLIQNFDLSKERIMAEQAVLKEKSSENFKETKQKCLNLEGLLLTLEVREELLHIKIENENLADQMIGLDKFEKVRKIRVDCQQCDSFFQDPFHLNSFYKIFHLLNKYTSLTVNFGSKDITNVRAAILFDLLFIRVQQLVDIEIWLERCEISNETILFFCSDILPKATFLKNFRIRLCSTLIDDLSLVSLAKSLSAFSQNLEIFGLGVEHTAITNDGIEKIFHAVEGVKELYLYLQGTLITDRSLKALGNHMTSRLKKLEKFVLIVNRTKITLEGVNAIFKGVPEGIKGLSLGFEGVNLPDEVLSLFEENVSPKLGSVENVLVTLEGRDLTAKILEILKAARDRSNKSSSQPIKENN